MKEGNVLSHLAKASGPASLREIARAMELRHNERRELQKMIERMKRKGEIEEVQKVHAGSGFPLVSSPKGSRNNPARKARAVSV